jgi:hypothetical protein
MHTLAILGAVLAARGPGCVVAAVFGVAAAARPVLVARRGRHEPPPAQKDA